MPVVPVDAPVPSIAAGRLGNGCEGCARSTREFMSSTNQLIAEGLERHRAGRLADAESLYREALAGDPNSADAFHLLGLIASQQGRFEAAVRQIHEAIRLAPAAPILRNNLGT